MTEYEIEILVSLLEKYLKNSDIFDPFHHDVLNVYMTLRKKAFSFYVNEIFGQN